MGRQIIELVQVLVDRIEKNGYQQRAREDDIADVYKRLNEAEGQAKHWKAARDTAIEGGELLLKSNQSLQAEIETLRQQLAEAQQPDVDAMRVFVGKVRAVLDREYDGRELDDLNEALDELDAQPAPVAETAEGGT